RERGRIARGHTGIEARLDLHGLTLIRAHAVLRRFLVRAQGEGLTLVLVITGKGGRDGKGSGALRREVPEWLALAEFRGLVVGFEEAHAAHGGAGALYVRVRRGR
ncbi:MAG: Smr/MutS family protein, partial [Xanthobacteraceae bacterium]